MISAAQAQVDAAERDALAARIEFEQRVAAAVEAVREVDDPVFSEILNCLTANMHQEACR